MWLVVRGAQSFFQIYSTFFVSTCLVVFTSVTHSSPIASQPAISLAILVPKRSPFYEISIYQKKPKARDTRRVPARTVETSLA